MKTVLVIFLFVTIIQGCADTEKATEKRFTSHASGVTQPPEGKLISIGVASKIHCGSDGSECNQFWLEPGASPSTAAFGSGIASCNSDCTSHSLTEVRTNN